MSDRNIETGWFGSRKYNGYAESEDFAQNRGDNCSADDERRLRESFGVGAIANVAVGISNWIDRNVAESEERDRILSNESRLKEFEAWQECPKCNKFGHYLFEDVNFGALQGKKGVWWSVIRRCKYCNHAWYQR